MNIIGYGLAKFDIAFAKQMGFNTKNDFYSYLVKIGVCDTIGAVKNRQDMLDPFFDNGRKGWHQKREQYISRKLYIDSFLGNENVDSFATIVKMYIQDKCNIVYPDLQKVSPIVKSRYRNMQETGIEAEMYFFHNYQTIEVFQNGVIEDARLYGDGYDFQIKLSETYYLAEVKGIKEKKGSIRLTDKEYEQAKNYRNDYVLVVVSNLIEIPKISVLFNPIESLSLDYRKNTSTQIMYYSQSLIW